MFPIRINLLSPEKKKNLEKIRNFQFIKSIFELFLLLLSIIAIFLLLSQWILQNYFNSLTSNVVDISNEKTKEIMLISQINQLVKNTSDLQKNYHEVSPFLIKIAEKTPAGIKFYSLNLKFSENKIIINGNAADRKIFIEFKENLEKLDFVKTAFSPLSDLAKQSDIDFSLTLEI
ncbi:MAG: hypothetical protein WC414_03190 [Patescibacteria group bacterium]